MSAFDACFCTVHPDNALVDYFCVCGLFFSVSFSYLTLGIECNITDAFGKQD